MRLRVFIAAGLVATTGLGAANAATSTNDRAATSTCSSGYVTANLSWGTKCLRVGEFCKIGNPEYRRYGFTCPATGYLAYSGGSTSGPSAPSAPASVGRTVLVSPRARTTACRRGSLPDRRCSPGAYYDRLSRSVICSPSFRTSAIRNVSQDEKFQVEQEYGMAPSYYGRTIEIDHIVPLELGGSNDIANLFPEPGSGAASYHLKDVLENKLHDLVCSGALPLHAAQRGIATNWEGLYRRFIGALSGD